MVCGKTFRYLLIGILRGTTTTMVLPGIALASRTLPMELITSCGFSSKALITFVMPGLTDTTSVVTRASSSTLRSMFPSGFVKEKTSL